MVRSFPLGLFEKIMNFQEKVLSWRGQQCEAVAPKSGCQQPAGRLYSLPTTLDKLHQRQLNSTAYGELAWLRVSKTVFCPKRDQLRGTVINTTFLASGKECTHLDTDWAVLIHNSICPGWVQAREARGEESIESLQMPATVTSCPATLRQDHIL